MQAPAIGPNANIFHSAEAGARKGKKSQPQRWKAGVQRPETTCCTTRSCHGRACDLEKGHVGSHGQKEISGSSTGRRGGISDEEVSALQAGNDPDGTPVQCVSVESEIHIILFPWDICRVSLNSTRPQVLYLATSVPHRKPPKLRV